MKIGQKDFFIAGMYFAVHPQVYELVYIGHRCKASSLVNHRYAFVNMGEQVFFFHAGVGVHLQRTQVSDYTVGKPRGRFC